MNSLEMAVMLPVLTIVGSLVGAFGGVWLGRYLKRRNEAMKWRRDHPCPRSRDRLRKPTSWGHGAGRGRHERPKVAIVRLSAHRRQLRSRTPDSVALR
jgi:hypothetical protein